MNKYDTKILDDLIDKEVEPLLAGVNTKEDKVRVAKAFGDTAILAATFYKGDISEQEVMAQFCNLMAKYCLDIMATRPFIATYVMRVMYDALNFPNKAVAKLTANSN